MRDGEWASGLVRQVSPVVTGMPGVTVQSVDITRELPSSLPGQSRSVGGLSAATATVTGHVDSGVTDRVGTPWTRPDWPQSGDRVTVSATDGQNTHRVLTGKVDGSASSLADMGVSIPLVDDTDRLSATVSHNAVLRVMPPRTTVGTGDRRLTGMLSTYVTNLAARAAGYYSTPPMGGFCVVSAPLAGSTWPERGVLDWSGRFNATTAGWSDTHPGTSALGDSLFMYDVMAEWIPDQYDQPYSGGITASRPLNITLGANGTLSNSGYVDVRWSGAGWLRYIQLAVSSTRSLTGRIISDGDYGNQNVVVQLPGADAPGWRFATLTVSRPTDTSSNLRFTIETDTGVTATGTTTGGGTAIRDTMWERARLYAPDYVGLNGVQVGYGATPPAREFQRTFLTRPDDPLANMEVLPHLAAVPARDLLQQQAEVECAAVWIDEDGTLRWLGHQRMIDGPIVRTLTSSDIADAAITIDSQDVRRQVTGKYTTWATKTTKTSRIIVHEGSKDEYEAGDHGETIITPPNGEEWVMVDSTPREVWGNIGSTYFNLGYGSYHGYTALRADGSEIPFAPGDGSTPWSFTPAGPGAWKWSFTVDKLPSGADRVKTATRSEETEYIKATYRDRGLPLLRAMGRATSTEDTYTVGGGPAWASDLEVDFGWWVQHRSQVITKIQRIAQELRKARAMLSGFEVLADPRLQLGDRIRVVEDARTGLEVVGIVSSKPEGIAPGQHTMTLELNILEVKTPWVTLGEFAASHHGKTLGEVASLYAGKSMGQVVTTVAS